MLQIIFAIKSYSIKSSKWNSSIGKEKICFLIREHSAPNEDVKV
jgi:hypothetical protein